MKKNTKGNIYGYIRVSTISQRDDRQWLALEDFGIPKKCIFVDKQSGKDSLGIKPMEKPKSFQAIHAEWEAGKVSARKVAEALGVSTPTFLKWANASTDA